MRKRKTKGQFLCDQKVVSLSLLSFISPRWREKDERKRAGGKGTREGSNVPDSLGKRTALTNSNDVTDLDTESGGAVDSDVLVALLVCNHPNHNLISSSISSTSLNLIISFLSLSLSSSFNLI